jgi:hypothetical protein
MHHARLVLRVLLLFNLPFGPYFAFAAEGITATSTTPSTTTTTIKRDSIGTTPSISTTIATDESIQPPSVLTHTLTHLITHVGQSPNATVPHPTTLLEINPHCGLVALPTRQFYVISQEITLTAQLNVTSWKSLFRKCKSFLTRALTHWKALSPKSPAVQQAISHGTMFDNHYIYLLNQLSLFPQLTTLFPGEIALTIEPYATLRENLQAQFANLNAQTPDTTNVPLVERVFTAIETLLHVPYLLMPAFPDIVNLLLRNHPVCFPTTSHHTISTILHEQFTWPNFSHQIPCLSDDSRVQEYVIKAFPTAASLYQTAPYVETPIIWKNLVTHHLLAGHNSSLLSYTPLSTTVFRLPVLQDLAIPDIIRLLISAPHPATTNRCPLNIPSSLLPQVIILNHTSLLYMPSWQDATTHHALIFLCNAQRVTFTIKHVLQHISLGQNCQFSAPADSIIEQHVLFNGTQPLYLSVHLQPTPHSDKTELSIETKGKTLTMSANKYFMYAIYAFSGTGAFAILYCMRTCIFKSFKICYSHITSRPGQPIQIVPSTIPADIDTHPSASQSIELAARNYAVTYQWAPPALPWLTTHPASH